MKREKAERSVKSILWQAISALHLFVGIGALFGGMAALLNPYGGMMGITLDILRYSPFNSFIIPGVFLFGVIGLGNLFGAIMMRRRSKYQGYISSVFGWALVIWIIVQCIMLRSVAALHVIFFFIGIVQSALAFVLLLREKLFPADLLLKAAAKLEEKHPESAAASVISQINKLLGIDMD